jgi:hypothetical protein
VAFKYHAARTSFRVTLIPRRLCFKSSCDLIRNLSTHTPGTWLNLVESVSINPNLSVNVVNSTCQKSLPSLKIHCLNFPHGFCSRYRTLLWSHSESFIMPDRLIPSASDGRANLGIDSFNSGLQNQNFESFD